MQSEDANVLILETDNESLLLLEDVLTDLGCFVDVVSTGVAALEHLRSHTPSLAILSNDLEAEPNGLDVCFRSKRIRRLQDMPVMVLSSTLDARVEDHALLAKADAVLQRPLERAQLRATVLALLLKASQDKAEDVIFEE